MTGSDEQKIERGHAPFHQRWRDARIPLVFERTSLYGGDMGLLDRLAVGGGLALVGTGLAYLFRSARETARRRSTPPEFDARLSQQDFSEIANRLAETTPRVIRAETNGLIVRIFVRSNSGLSIWSAELDFNDYGRPSGQYWINTENKQSPIPEFFASSLQHEILQRTS